MNQFATFPFAGALAEGQSNNASESLYLHSVGLPASSVVCIDLRCGFGHVVARLSVWTYGIMAVRGYISPA